MVQPIHFRIRITDPDLHQDDGDPHADPTPVVHMLENIEKINFFQSYASLQRFSSIFEKFSLKNQKNICAWNLYRSGSACPEG